MAAQKGQKPAAQTKSPTPPLQTKEPTAQEELASVAGSGSETLDTNKIVVAVGAVAVVGLLLLAAR